MLTLVLGGARSGKSRYAQSLCGDGPVVYVATAVAGDDEEMQRRIERHRRDRPARWTTVEESLDVAAAVHGAQPSTAPVLVDCITVWISNLLWQHRHAPSDDRQRSILEAVDALVELGQARTMIVVSNEVGAGVVPEHPVARAFRDLQGQANQGLAEGAGRVVLVVAGLAVVLKDTRGSTPSAWEPVA